MAAATILFVGDDHCHRVPVMETNGMRVVRSACSVEAVRAALAKGAAFRLSRFITIPLRRQAVVSTARELCKAPLILFKNPAVDCEERAFDFEITVPMSPDVLTRALAEAIEEARKSMERERKPKRERADARE